MRHVSLTHTSVQAPFFLHLSAFYLIFSYIHTLMTQVNSAPYISLSFTMTCRLEQPGIRPSTFWLEYALLYVLSHSVEYECNQIHLPLINLTQAHPLPTAIGKHTQNHSQIIDNFLLQNRSEAVCWSTTLYDFKTLSPHHKVDVGIFTSCRSVKKTLK